MVEWLVYGLGAVVGIGVIVVWLALPISWRNAEQQDESEFGFIERSARAFDQQKLRATELREWAASLKNKKDIRNE